jgi:tetratricopeptide (TPR) repeat protein
LTYARASANTATVRMVLAATTDITAQERSVALGGAYMNEYYSSNESNLLDLAAEEFQKVLNVQPQNLAALEWMGAVEYLRWDKPPTLEQFKKTYSLLKKSVDLEPKDPDRNYWIAAISSIFASAGKGVPATNLATILDDGILHATKALELDAQFADAMDHLGILYGLKGDHVAAATARSNALRVRQRLGNRPSRFSDQFSRPALPAPPA